MNSPSRSTQWLVWGLLGVTIAVITAAYVRSLQTHAPKLPVLFTVPNFTLTNQHGAPFSLEQLRGSPWLVDIIFTRCAGPCPEMTRKMSALQQAIPRDRTVQFVTLTTDPTADTPPVLLRYAKKFGAQDRWNFLTGTKAQIAQIAGTQGLKFTAIEKNPDQRESETDLFIHSTIVILVDGAGRARAVFETELPDFQTAVVNALQALEQERFGSK